MPNKYEINWFEEAKNVQVNRETIKALNEGLKKVFPIKASNGTEVAKEEIFDIRNFVKNTNILTNAFTKVVNEDKVYKHTEEQEKAYYQKAAEANKQPEKLGYIYGVFSNTHIGDYIDDKDLSESRDAYKLCVEKYGADFLKRGDVKKAVRNLSRLETAKSMSLLQKDMEDMAKKIFELSSLKAKIDRHETAVKAYIRNTKEQLGAVDYSKLDTLQNNFESRKQFYTSWFRTQKENKEKLLAEKMGESDVIKSIDSRLDRIAKDKETIKLQRKQLKLDGEWLKETNQSLPDMSVVFEKYHSDLKNLQDKQQNIDSRIKEIREQIRKLEESRAAVEEAENTYIGNLKLDDFGKNVLHNVRDREIEFQRARELWRVSGNAYLMGIVYDMCSYAAHRDGDLVPYLNGKIEGYMRQGKMVEGKRQDLSEDDRRNLMAARDLIVHMDGKDWAPARIRHEISEKGKLCFEKGFASLFEECLTGQEGLLKAFHNTSYDMTDIHVKVSDYRGKVREYGYSIEGLQRLMNSMEADRKAVEEEISHLNNSGEVDAYDRELRKHYFTLYDFSKNQGYPTEDIPDGIEKNTAGTEKLYHFLAGYFKRVAAAVKTRNTEYLEHSKTLDAEKEELLKKKDEEKNKITADLDKIIQNKKNEYEEFLKTSKLLAPIKEEQARLASEHGSILLEIKDGNTTRKNATKAFDQAVITQIQDALLKKYRTLNDARRSGENSKEYEAMIKPLCDTLGLGIPAYGADLSSAEKNPENTPKTIREVFDNLVVMKTMAREYIQAKKQQSFTWGTAQRFQRLTMAEELIDLCDDVMTQAAAAYTYTQKLIDQPFKDYDERIKDADQPGSFLNSKTDEKVGSFANLLNTMAGQPVQKSEQPIKKGEEVKEERIASPQINK